ncbi:MAG: hypothetical protein DRP06_04345 [Candidatus Aenigmatarchaeota archaeon]|nr:MAG: hypothetical protein DRP06_04345 [Candidatus Aenigmarchaeota archaeon]
MRQILFSLLIAVLLTGIIPMVVYADGPAINIIPMRYEPSPAQPGEYLSVWVNVENFGNEKAEDLLVVLVPTYPFSLDEGENATTEIKTLDGMDNSVIEYKVRIAADAIEGENELIIKYSTKDRNIWVEKKLKIVIQTLDANLAITGVESREVSPGDITNLKIKLKNEADSYLRDVNIKLNISGSTFLSINSTEDRKIYLIGSKEEKTVDFDLLVSPSAECGPYKILTFISYYDSAGVYHTKTNYVTLIVTAEPEITVNIDKSGILAAGQTGTVSLNIINKGLIDLKFLTISLKPDGYEILSPSEVYIGSLDSDDYDTVDFKIHTPENGKEHPLKIELVYKDANNKMYSDEYAVNLRLYTQEELKNYNLVLDTTGTTNTIIFIILLFVGYWVYKKLKKSSYFSSKKSK